MSRRGGGYYTNGVHLINVHWTCFADAALEMLGDLQYEPTQNMPLATAGSSYEAQRIENLEAKGLTTPAEIEIFDNEARQIFTKVLRDCGNQYVLKYSEMKQVIPPATADEFKQLWDSLGIEKRDNGDYEYGDPISLMYYLMHNGICSSVENHPFEHPNEHKYRVQYSTNDVTEREHNNSLINWFTGRTLCGGAPGNNVAINKQGCLIGTGRSIDTLMRNIPIFRNNHQNDEFVTGTRTVQLLENGEHPWVFHIKWHPDTPTKQMTIDVPLQLPGTDMELRSAILFEGRNHYTFIRRCVVDGLWWKYDDLANYGRGIVYMTSEKELRKQLTRAVVVMYDAFIEYLHSETTFKPIIEPIVEPTVEHSNKELETESESESETESETEPVKEPTQEPEKEPDSEHENEPAKEPEKKLENKQKIINVTRKKGFPNFGARRQHKILRDNIQGITKPAIRRLARRGGVKRFSGLIYEETRGVLKVFLENVIRESYYYTEHAKRKTVTALDVVHALKRQDRTLYGFGG